MVADVAAWGAAGTNAAAVDIAIADLRRATAEGTNIMGPSIALTKAGGTTGEWQRHCAKCSASTALRPASARPSVGASTSWRTS